MEILHPHNEEFRAFKTCRLCGSNNKENIDIFTSKPISPRSEDLLTKILTVYPLVLYKDDPLPQHICPKCIGNVSTTYQDIQQVLRQQNKWLKLAKAVEPEHKYFHILNAVENSTKATKERIKTTYNIAVNNIPLGNLLSTTVREHQNAVSPIKPTNTEDINETVVKNIQNKLESNGFTIKRIKVVPSAYSNAELNSATDPIETNVNLVSCKHCKEKFSNLKILAQHQLIHLKLNVNKIFQKHLLPKHLRRGRLITLNDNKCIRCLNCWRIHKDNKAILQHWSVGECEFYCFVCGKEFPHSPKLLRDHITEVHGVSYRSIKSELTTIKTQNVKPISVEETKMHSFEPHSAAINLNPTVVKKVYKKPPPKSCTKNADGTITCKICHKVFDNFRSSNSHMRKHKPPTRIGDAFVGLSVATDKYHTADDYGLHPSTSKTYYNNASLSNSQHIKPPRPPYRVIMTNGGIKTKIVQKRHDFLSNYEAHNSRPAQRPMASSPDIDDDENLIVPELLTTAIKSEHSPTIDTQNNGRNGLKYAEYESNPLKPTIKSEPLDNTDYGVTKETHFCFICNESFATSRDYQLHAMFVHNIN